MGGLPEVLRIFFTFLDLGCCYLDLLTNNKGSKYLIYVRNTYASNLRIQSSYFKVFLILEKLSCALVNIKLFI